MYGTMESLDKYTVLNLVKLTTELNRTESNCFRSFSPVCK